MTPAAVAYILQAAQLMPTLIGVFQSIVSMTSTGRDPTPEEIAALDKMRDDLHRQVQA